MNPTKYRVRYACINYDNGTEMALAFRDMVVDDIPEDRAAVLLAEGAIVAAEYQLDRPGTLLPLPVAPTDEELITWVASASQVELDQTVAQRPEMRARVLDARQAYEERMALHLKSMGQKVDAMAETPEAPEEPTETQVSTDTTVEPTLDDAYFDSVVAQNAPEVQKFISEYPQFAAQVMDAENRKAAVDGGDPRKGVEAAVKAAAGFASQ